VLLAEEVLDLGQFFGLIGYAFLGIMDHASKSYKIKTMFSDLKPTFVDDCNAI